MKCPDTTGQTHEKMRLPFTILAPLKTRFLDSGQSMVRILSDIFPIFLPQNPPIFPFFDSFLLNFFSLVFHPGSF